MIKNISLGIIFQPLFSSLFGQNVHAKNGFKPTDKPFVKIYTDFHKNFCGGKHRSLFEAARACQVSPWNFSEDGQELIAGVGFPPEKEIKVSPDYQLWEPPNAAYSSVSGVYLSLEIEF